LRPWILRLFHPQEAFAFSKTKKDIAFPFLKYAINSLSIFFGLHIDIGFCWGWGGVYHKLSMYCCSHNLFSTSCSVSNNHYRRGGKPNSAEEWISNA
jgi:hypothetical protein